MFREFVVGHQKRQDERDAAMSLAWHIAAFSRQQKLPALKTLLSGSRRPKPQTAPQQKQVLSLLSEQYGLKLRPVKRKGGDGR